MNLSSILFVLLLALGCAHKAPSAPAAVAVRAEPSEPTDTDLARVVRNRSSLPETLEATDAELARVRIMIPTLHANMAITEVFEHLGVSRLLQRVHWVGSNSDAGYFAWFYLRLNHTYTHTPLTIIIAPGGRVIGVRFEDIKWPAA